MARDPVCGVQVDEKTPARSVSYTGTTYYFCDAACKAIFVKNPERYAGKTVTYMTGGRQRTPSASDLNQPSRGDGRRVVSGCAPFQRCSAPEQGNTSS